MILICVTGAKYLEIWVNGFEIKWLMIPDFVYALFIGVIITNTLEVTKLKKLDIETIDVLGTVSLALFLAMALMSLKLWNILDLAIPFLIILMVQSAMLAIFAYVVTFRVMGKDLRCCRYFQWPLWFWSGRNPDSGDEYGFRGQSLWPFPSGFYGGAYCRRVLY